MKDLTRNQQMIYESATICCICKNTNDLSILIRMTGAKCMTMIMSKDISLVRRTIYVTNAGALCSKFRALFKIFVDMIRT